MRKLALIAPLALTLTLSACASGAGVLPAPEGFDASAGQFEGWARVEAGEIRLYREQSDLSRGFSTNCLSAALPRNAQDSAGEVNGSRVRLHGRTAPWASRDGAETYGWQGSLIVNNCRREVVILADRIEVLR
ncbi:MAG: hypothetical protein REJ23_07120 [Brevundimonas sp.]|nr:hypothetical protein [Brevundimonas sp.]